MHRLGGTEPVTLGKDLRMVGAWLKPWGRETSDPVHG